VLSAVGLLESPRRRELVRSWTGGTDEVVLATALQSLGHEARRQAGEGAVVETALDCRYVGQSHEITVASVDAFAAAHAERNGYVRPDTPVEVVALRARASTAAPLSLTDLPVRPRASVIGPAVAAESDCTVYVPEGWRAEPGPLGAWILRRTA
jgi:N-methylhydantoinase A/oxoprolinase/acetone carboxylase beta subunit